VGRGTSARSAAGPTTASGTTSVVPASTATRLFTGEFTEADLVARYGDQCYHCGAGPFQCIDHLTCVRVGGTHTRDNVVPCCQACNRL
jgi:hypothetical protein